MPIFTLRRFCFTTPIRFLLYTFTRSLKVSPYNQYIAYLPTYRTNTVSFRHRITFLLLFHLCTIVQTGSTSFSKLPKQKLLYQNNLFFQIHPQNIQIFQRIHHDIVSILLKLHSKFRIQKDQFNVRYVWTPLKWKPSFASVTVLSVTVTSVFPNSTTLLGTNR